MSSKKHFKLIPLLLLVLVLVLSGCSPDDSQNNASTNSTNSTKVSAANKQSDQKIVVTINGQKLQAHLNDSSAAKAFAKELPTTLSFRDFADMPEKIADLNHSLPTKGMPVGHAGTKGSIGYWSPQQRIVFYWGTESYYEGIHIIGTFDSDNYRNVIKNMGNDVNVSIKLNN